MSPVGSLAWSPDGQTVATGTENGTIGLWHPFSDGERLSSAYVTEPDSPARKPESLSYYGQAHSQGSLELPLTCVLARSGIYAHNAKVTSLAWSADGRLASGSLDGGVVLWDMQSGTELVSVTLPDAVLNVIFVYCDRILIVQTPDRVLFLACRSLETLWEQEYASPYDPGSSDGGLALALCSDSDSSLALISADDPTKIDVCEVDYPVLAAKALGLHRSHRAVGVCLLGPAASGKTSLANALSGRTTPAERAVNDLVVHRSTDLVGGINLNEVRELALWDPPSDQSHHLVQDIHRSDCAISIATIRPVPGLELTARRNLDNWLHQLSRHRSPRSSPRTSPIVVVTFADDICPAPKHADIAALAEHLRVASVYLTNATTGRGIAELRDAILQRIDWASAACADSSELLEGFVEFVHFRRDKGKCISTATELREGFLRRNPRITEDMLTDEQTHKILQLLKLRNEVYFFQASAGVLLLPSYFRTYAEAMFRAAEADPAGMGRLPIVEATTGAGKQIRIEQPACLARATDHRELLRLVVDEVVSAGVAQKVSTDGIDYLVFPCSLTRTRDTIARSTAHFRCKVLGRFDEMFSALVVRLLGQNIHYPKSELWKNEASFIPATGGKCEIAIEPLDVDGGEAQVSVFFDYGTERSEKKKFLGLIQQHFAAYSNAVAESIEYFHSADTSDPPSVRNRPRVFLSWRAESDMLTGANVSSIAQSLRADGLDVTDSEHHNLGWTSREQAIDFQEYDVAVVLFAKAPNADHASEIRHFLKAGVRMIPVILPNAPRRAFSIPTELTGWPVLDLRGRFLDIAALVGGISRAWELGTFRPRSDRKGVFISYAHKDDRLWLNRIRTHIQWLEARGIPVWTDREIRPGSLWHESIQEALDRSRVAILMVSPDFLASTYIQNSELPKLLEASAKDGLRVFWIPIRASAYRQTTISKFQAAHPPDKPLAALSSSERDAALVAIGELLAREFRFEE